MIRYQVGADVRAEDALKYEAYLRTQHIPDLLRTGCFTEASFETRGPGQFRTVYLAPDEAALQRYLTDFAPSLRAHVLELFPVGLVLSRETWTVLEQWTPPRLPQESP